MRTPQQDRVGTRSAAEPDAPRFYSVTQVAQMFRVAPVTMYRAIRAGQFPAVRIRGRLIVPAKAVEAMAEAAAVDRTVVDAAGWVPEQVARS